MATVKNVLIKSFSWQMYYVNGTKGRPQKTPQVTGVAPTPYPWLAHEHSGLGAQPPTFGWKQAEENSIIIIHSFP